MMKRCLAILLSVLLLTACAAGGQAPAPEPSTLPQSPSSVSEPASAPSSEMSSQPEPSSVSEPESSQPEKEPVPAPESERNPLLSPDQGEVNPDTGPDFGDGAYSDVFAQRAEPLREALLPALKAIEDDYSYFFVWVADESLDVVLEIGVIHEDKVDRFLADWTGPSWDQLEKKPGCWPVAAQEAFAAEAAKLKLGPGVNIRTQTAVGAPEVVSVNVWLDDLYASQEEVNRWAELPQAVKDLARRMDAPEDLIDYMAPRYTAPGNNPDT